MFVDGLQEAFRSGIDGASQEAGLYTQPWGLRLQDITAEIHPWHGGQDANVSVSVGHYFADAIPNCNARFYEEEGYLTLPHNRISEVLSTPLS